MGKKKATRFAPGGIVDIVVVRLQLP